ncbi:MAG: hypothetical protein IJ129_05240 [Ruminococcus sp.]|nr:hypothetical protein [Ruminococcus sp.]
MKLRVISKYNSLVKNILLSFASSVVGAYMIMCGVWLITGMRYDALKCVYVYIYAFWGMLCAFVGASVIFTVKRKQELEEVTKHYEEHGSDDEYFTLLKKYLGEPLSNSKLLLYASCHLEGGRYAEGRRVLKQIDFAKLSADDQEEYFNICLYSAVLEKNKELANDIYFKARHYFDRAVMYGKNRYILHTLGMLCLLNGNLENAYTLFMSAMKERNVSLRCECDIGLGHCFLQSGDLASAKEMCYTAAEQAVTRSQAIRLKELMIAVEDAYRRAG